MSDRHISQRSVHEVADRVLSHLFDAPALCSMRSGTRLGYVSALQVLTERLLGFEVESTAPGSEHHTFYWTVAAAVNLLEVEGFITVTRAGSSEANKGVFTERIEVAL